MKEITSEKLVNFMVSKVRQDYLILVHLTKMTEITERFPEIRSKSSLALKKSNRQILR